MFIKKSKNMRNDKLIMMRSYCGDYFSRNIFSMFLFIWLSEMDTLLMLITNSNDMHNEK